MATFETVSRWGLLLPAIALGTLLGVRLGAIALPEAPARERALFGAVGALAVTIVGVRGLGAVGGLEQKVLFGTLFALAVTSAFVARSRRLGLSWRTSLTLETLPVAVVAGASLLVTMTAAYLLPIWQWDALGYHLPYVNFALQGHDLAGVPRDVPYVGTYPHVVENFFLAWRAMLPDDRLVDAAQIPFGLLGAAAIAVVASQAGARRDHALAAGFLWLTLPAVFLQLPTNYVDVASAALLLAGAALCLADPTAPLVLAAGVALGLFLGSKPNAPIGASLLFTVLAVRGWRAGRRESLFGAAVIMTLLGAEAFVTNLVRHGNPTWPVALKLGPLVLPGPLTMKGLLETSCASPKVEGGSVLVRVFHSWTSLDATPVFDMHYGGLGILFLVALPIALAFVVRRRAWPIAIVMVAALASPDPSVPRYTLAFPGLVLALAMAWLSSRTALVRRWTFAVAATIAGITLFRAAPGLTGEGPPLTAYFEMSEAERRRAVGADDSVTRFYDAIDRVPPSKTTAYDASLELQLLAWPSNLSSRAQYIADDISNDDIARLVSDPDLALLIVNETSRVAAAARSADPPFTQLFRCQASPPPACLLAETPALASCVVLARPTDASLGGGGKHALR